MTPSNRQNPRGLHGPHFQTPAPQVALEICRGRARERFRPVSVPVFLIGTAADCDLVLGDPQFPEAYAYLMANPEDVSIRWLEVGPAMSVSGQAVRSARLDDGDAIRMGPYEFRIHIDWQRQDPRGHGPRGTEDWTPAEEIDPSVGEVESMSGIPTRRKVRGGLHLYVERRTQAKSSASATGQSTNGQRDSGGSQGRRFA